MNIFCIMEFFKEGRGTIQEKNTISCWPSKTAFLYYCCFLYFKRTGYTASQAANTSWSLVAPAMIKVFRGNTNLLNQFAWQEFGIY